MIPCSACAAVQFFWPFTQLPGLLTASDYKFKRGAAILTNLRLLLTACIPKRIGRALYQNVFCAAPVFDHEQRGPHGQLVLQRGAVGAGINVHRVPAENPQTLILAILF